MIPTRPDFAARKARRAKVRHRGRRLAALALAVGVPAFAAPTDWQAFSLTGDKAELATTERMPFEQAGQSFPGSAFYYLEDTPRVAYDNTLDAAPALFDPSGTGSLEASEQLAASRAGAAARAFFGRGSSLSQGRALECLTQAIYYEAASEAIAGQRAVAQVVLNRVAHPSYPNSVCGVVFQGSERRTGCQFSFTCDGSMRRRPSLSAWSRAQMVARDALAGYVYAPVGLATHYHTIWIYPYWAPSLDHIGTIGAHRFYRWKGSAGKPSAFNSAYAGYEPATRPNLRKPGEELAGDTAVADPLALQRAFEEARIKAEADNRVGAARPAATGRAAGTRQPAPSYSREVEARGGDSLYTAEKLPDSDVRPEYANSGQWIAPPR